MERKEYFQELRETSNVVTPFLLQRLEKENIEEPVKSFVEVLPKRRAKNPRLRDLILRLSFEASGGKNWQKVIPPYATAVEIYNNSTYIINWFLDGKGELKSEKDKQNAVMAGFLLRELSQKIIEEHQTDKTLEIISGLAEVDKGMYRGQNLDLNILTVNNFDNYSNEKKFLEAYYKKGNLVCGYFASWIAKMGNLLAEKDDKIKNVLCQFVIDLSAGVQLANDAGDFIPYQPSIGTPDKSYKDQMTDIANGRLTLATWHCLKYGTKKQKDALLNLVEKRNATLEEQEKATYALKDAGSLDFILTEADRLMNQCRRTLHKLPPSRERNLLSTMASIVRTNKFYGELRKRYGIRGKKNE